MSIIKQDFGKLLGGNEDGSVFLFEDSDMTSLTDSNKLVIYGDFSKIKTVIIIGYYSTGTGNYGHNTRYTYTNTADTYLDTGNYIQWVVAKTQPGFGETPAWRRIWFYSDRIEIGQGGYSSTNNSSLGIIKMLAVSNDTVTILNT